MNTSVRAAVVGAGAIGAMLDVPGVMFPLTHAGGYVAAGFSLAALVDIDGTVRAASDRWGCRVYADFDAMMGAEHPDVISLAVPTAARSELLHAALSYRPKAVVAEKPLASTTSEAEAIVRAYREACVPLLVNYSRRFIPLWQDMRGLKAMTASIRYAKGLRHNGTHAIDLCRMLFGECLEATGLTRKFDHWPDDPTVTGFLKFEGCPEVFLQSLDERCFTLFEVDIVTNNSRIVVDSDGRRLRRYALREGIGCPPGKRLVKIGEEDTGAASAMLNLMNNVAEVLNGHPPRCSGEDAVAAQKIADSLVA